MIPVFKCEECETEFFVDIYPWRKIGEKKFANLCQKIIKRGHKINLHTHPSKMFDSKRTFMHQYSQKEQIEILKLGKKKIKQWTGKYPLAHRARGYGINQDTFKALKKVNIKYDCSYFYQNKNCHLQTEIVNRPFIHHDILEIPVTVFCRKIKYNLLNFNIKYGKKYYQKLDLRYGVRLSEIKKVIKKTAKNDIIVIFLHSFNFLNLPYNQREKQYLKPSVNHKIIQDFAELIKWLSQQKNCIFTNIDKLNFKKPIKDHFQCLKTNIPVIKKIRQIYHNKILKRPEI